MTSLNLVFAEPVIDKCPCCDGQATRLTRVVERDGAPYALYFALFTETHPERHIEAIVSLGDFQQGSRPANREAFAVTLRRTAEGVGIRVLDATRSPWRDVDQLGRKLTEPEARTHPRLDEVYEIGTYAVQNDAVLFGYLARAGGCSACAQPCAPPDSDHRSQG